MGFNKDEMDVLKSLVKKELTDIEKEGENFKVVNSPVLSTIVRFRDTDLEFLKSEKMYIEFLKDLLKKF